MTNGTSDSSDIGTPLPDAKTVEKQGVRPKSAKSCFSSASKSSDKDNVYITISEMMSNSLERVSRFSSSLKQTLTALSRVCPHEISQ